MCWDFDGTIHKYSAGWVGETPADELPIVGVAATMALFHSKGFDQVVLSARAATGPGRVGIIEWLRKHDLLSYISLVTHVKPQAIAYIDDRGVSFDGDWKPVVEAVHRLAERHLPPPRERKP